MDVHSQEKLKPQLANLLRRQADLLGERALGTATDAEIIDYEICREVIRDLGTQFANSSDA